jgi:amino acid transporter
MSTTPALKRALGFRDLTLFYVVSGLSVRWVASAAAGDPNTLVVWVIALVGFFIPLAASVLELSSRYPQEGGLYVWTREAFGDFFGFIAAWTYWMSNLPYFPAVLYFGAGSVLFAFGAHRESLASSGVYYAAFAVSWLAIITLLNIAGADVGKWLNNIGSVGSIVPLAVLCVLAAISGLHFGSATHFALERRHSAFCWLYRRNPGFCRLRFPARLWVVRTDSYLGCTHCVRGWELGGCLYRWRCWLD